MGEVSDAVCTSQFGVPLLCTCTEALTLFLRMVLVLLVLVLVLALVLGTLTVLTTTTLRPTITTAGDYSSVVGGKVGACWCLVEGWLVGVRHRLLEAARRRADVEGAETPRSYRHQPLSEAVGACAKKDHHNG